ncbi:hypothetical protein D3C75_619460 [compost metagenome]
MLIQQFRCLTCLFHFRQLVCKRSNPFSGVSHLRPVLLELEHQPSCLFNLRQARLQPEQPLLHLADNRQLGLKFAVNGTKGRQHCAAKGFREPLTDLRCNGGSPFGRNFGRNGVDFFVYGVFHLRLHELAFQDPRHPL